MQSTLCISGSISPVPAHPHPCCLPLPSHPLLLRSTDCIHELVGAGGGPCPICRAPLRPGDVYDIVSDAEAARDTLMAQAGGEYGAKV
jgi:hypothetical protein